MYAGKGRGWGEPGMYHFSWTSGSGQNWREEENISQNT
jgi:hypothetical protein